jgi:hypothetical protein
MFQRTGKRVSSTMIRRSIVCDAYNMSQLKQLADDMAHSVGMGPGRVCERGMSCRPKYGLSQKMRTVLRVSRKSSLLSVAAADWQDRHIVICCIIIR